MNSIGKNDMIYLLKIFAALICRLPRGVALSMGKLFGVILSSCQFRRKSVCFINMDILYEPVLSSSEKISLRKKMYVHMGKNLVEFLRLPLYSDGFSGPFMTMEGKENWDSAMKKGKSVLVVTAHLGFWDLLTVAFFYLGVKSSFVTKELRNKTLNEFWMSYRKFGSIQPIDKKNSSRALIQCIRNKDPIGFIMDQNMNLDSGVFVQFGNKQACTLNAPAILARRYDLPVLAAFAVRLPDDHYRFIITPEMPLIRTDNPGKDAIINTQTFSDTIRSHILKYPDQWIWMHRRWKTRPVGEPRVY
ncbi:MAG: lysophospholipid acyltransferase family protein [Candidatus Aureabacteria bacterium]|nr:lysophospholipid acyltransferase family protein [Candidatus Auribacterota bacterium]